LTPQTSADNGNRLTLEDRVEQLEKQVARLASDLDSEIARRLEVSRKLGERNDVLEVATPAQMSDLESHIRKSGSGNRWSPNVKSEVRAAPVFDRRRATENDNLRNVELEVARLASRVESKVAFSTQTIEVLRRSVERLALAAANADAIRQG